MILTVNVSNSNILLGAYQDDKQCFCSSMHTNLLKSADEYAVQFGSVLSLYGAQPEDISLEDRQKRFQWEISFVSWRVAWRLQHVREQKVTVAARVLISA